MQIRCVDVSAYIKEGGINGLLEIKYEGRTSFLTDAQKEQLKQHLHNTIYLDVNRLLLMFSRPLEVFKKTTFYNKYYEKFADFTQACKGFLKNIKKHEVALRTLLAENFHMQKN
jgi:hypothetical protein